VVEEEDKCECGMPDAKMQGTTSEIESYSFESYSFLFILPSLYVLS